MQVHLEGDKVEGLKLDPPLILPGTKHNAVAFSRHLLQKKNHGGEKEVPHLSRLLPDTPERILRLPIKSTAQSPISTKTLASLHLHLPLLASHVIQCESTVKSTCIAHFFGPELALSPLGALNSLCEVSTSTVALILILFLGFCSSENGFDFRCSASCLDPLRRVHSLSPCERFCVCVFKQRGSDGYCPPAPSPIVFLYPDAVRH